MVGVAITDSAWVVSARSSRSWNAGSAKAWCSSRSNLPWSGVPMARVTVSWCHEASVEDSASRASVWEAAAMSWARAPLAWRANG